MSKLIIAPFSMHKNLLRYYRKDDLFADVKIVSKESLISDWKGKIDSKAIKFILQNYNYSYDNIISMLPFLPYVDESVKELYKIKEALIAEGLLSKNEYLSTFFLDKEIDVYGYSEKDNELNGLIDYYSLKPHFVLNEKDIHGSIVFKYETVSDEVLFTLNKIAKLLSENFDIKKIYLYVKDNVYLQYLKKYVDNFGFSIDFNDSKPLYFYEISKQFLKSYKETKNFNSALEMIEDTKDENLLSIFKNTINDLYDEELSFDKQLDYFVGELKRTKYENGHAKNTVKIIDRPIFDEHAYIFVLGFTQGSFPENKKDNQLLSDNIKAKLGMNTSVNNSEINEEVLIDFFKSNNTFIYSFATRSLTDKYYPSPFIDKYQFNVKEDTLPSVIYSIDMADFIYAKLLDLKHSFSEESDDYFSLEKICNIPYGQYDNSFNGVNIYNDQQDINYSYSQIKSYYQCPFSYYLSNVLSIDPFEGNFYTKVGNVFHRVFEDAYKDNFDFEKSYLEQVSKEEFNDEEKVILNNLKEQLREMVKVLFLHHKHMTNPQYLTELNSRYQFAEHSYLKGKIDKTILLDQKYIALVDYKTGSESFNPKELIDGGSMQLPTYCLLAEHDELTKDYPIIGIYINNVIDKSLTINIGNNLINPAYQLNGYTIADVDTARMLDDTLIPGASSSFIKSLKLSKKDGSFNNNSKLMSEEDLEEYKRITLDNFVKADKRIRNNDFRIAPFYAGENKNACQYCQYRDICFVKKEQRRLPSDYQESEEENE